LSIYRAGFGIGSIISPVGEGSWSIPLQICNHLPKYLLGWGRHVHVHGTCCAGRGRNDCCLVSDRSGPHSIENSAPSTRQVSPGALRAAATSTSSQLPSKWRCGLLKQISGVHPVRPGCLVRASARRVSGFLGFATRRRSLVLPSQVAGLRP
jgi:hypothetical protein